MAAATAGFLAWNLSPARIFLGDSGATSWGSSWGRRRCTRTRWGEPDPLFRRRGGGVHALPVRHGVYARPPGEGAQERLQRPPGARLPEDHARPAKHRQVTNVYLGLAALSGLAASFGATGTVAGFVAGGALVFACCLFMAFLPSSPERRATDSLVPAQALEWAE
ncbi:hypothetical protein GBA65_03370 [Rubrobacter marinus]|uniref:Uncharacterized protein n=1 Tax=Rubrobacter marinus TaxID=2653852 RepID=A0A6G8PT90_9ACTN|nr:hypothetical protein GBA65_03370 [Rubrobacter marinus]